ncbi:copper resistance CopC family protein [Gandjariella thermophila]|uniref:Copper resistance protein C n=1 Tax=Gandjariella thermophila TaxID=1931992 RepID=A0A4D4J3P6_9PSEU|nr:copper resistance CopC family protein [Gandjariella thermophila]GDY31131.1 copper resistance protein C [Gandjariella thermophila]
MRRVLAVLLLAVTAVLGLATPAFAHNVLLGSDPADGAKLATGPAKVTLTFDQPVQFGFNTVTVTSTDGAHWEAGPATVAGNAVSAPVRPLGPAGEYTIGYRVLSADGHPVTGAVRFTLTTPGTGTPASVAPTGTAAPSAGGGGGTPVWPWIVGAVVLLAAGVVIALRLGRSEDGQR